MKNAHAINGVIAATTSEWEQLANFNKSVSDSLRLLILRVLMQDSFGVMELCHILDSKQSGMSHHLKILSQNGLLSTRREGNSIFYSRTQQHENTGFNALLHEFFSAIDVLELTEEIEQRMHEVQKNRAELSLAFFRKNANRFEQQQELIANHALYGQWVKDHLLSIAEIANTDYRQQTMLEIGPGNGHFLGSISPLFSQVIALDNTEEMLSLARNTGEKNRLTNIRYICGDTDFAIRQKLFADVIIINMVLHHTPSPAKVFQDIRQLLNPGGLLIITELCSHDQDWVKDACGDLWQGFEPDDLIQWGRQNGLQHEQNIFQALRNGFQIQIHSFYKPGST
ncbi:MAG: metalloregulator ArsR/SmtB family transcription factor [Pseudomonadales bacterium]|nr:metalloregulator ArsR/SmtB family transcription factor [Pseudomonadales bacterium]